MPINQIALVSETDKVNMSQLTRVAAALQKQATRDFGPLWEVQASINPFSALAEVLPGHWPIIIRDDIDVPGAAGVHLDRNGQPFALVSNGPSWALTASHEMLEMLADPFGNRVIPGRSPKEDQKVVEFLVEVADPSGSPENGYTVNGLLVSDFFTPHYHDPVTAPGVRYSFTGKLQGPRTILRGGYLSWRDPVTDHWWQHTWFNSKPKFRDLGRLTARAGSLRSAVDARTQTVDRLAASGPRSDRFAEAKTLTAAVKETARSRSDMWHGEIEELLLGKFPFSTWEGGEEKP